MAYVIAECIDNKEIIVAISVKEDRAGIIDFLRKQVAEGFVNRLYGYDYALRERLISLIKEHLLFTWDSDVICAQEPVIALVCVALRAPECSPHLLRQFTIFQAHDLSNTPPSPA